MHENAIIQLAKKFPHFHPEVQLGIGDDTAILGPLNQSSLLWTTDLLLEDVHFRRNYFSPEDLAWKALAVNLSDIAAMGGEPLAFTLGLGLPPEMDAAWIQAFFKALQAASEFWQVELVGGDTVRSSAKIVISINLLGTALHPTLQSGAQPGDNLFVSGSFGGAAAGLYCLENNLEGYACLKEKLLRPQPQLKAAQALSKICNRLALTDASDGLGRSLQLLCGPKLGCSILLEKVPCLPELKQLAEAENLSAWPWIIEGGEDYELVAALPPEQCAAAEKLGWIQIGSITPSPQIQIVSSDGSRHPLKETLGFQHF
ncbi:thiamine-phosphate kinase [bacterium (Candidatus Blackallbacteria) CG17_big_fil_post_rev_8_21_14_2_50_48_46]|uniref:Thiamine-monophosphate kinase n=1 Tax=bacterium (Candidatus Blackallbacteria) CG17_big_fil_post_rev_8_21_14_2_50_48_46 TaxID=2014261 RepID=A0A2M7G2R8_9BACT|nr:MAG: thiamine-phosphate kinase [bacterium (Candidatus Blackallbacteria) CG18_big_fil_WC_8_21_14_2_50_49_26]PIW16084.1 MAG: thiamine-phosphate kinase [bacterium (Candidatus Blackallbacteria) CG17_big_fil_post_rev_8_21_14_2_50_48_46]PIW50496.1 MAG: thiamine-phosphate kinase [bacterium (Candidatus Blackallbacteria) CG13_big_fil_rev_8_21_14_2_50_49_14]